MSPAKWTEPVLHGEATDWQAKFCLRCALMTSSAIREILKITQRPDIISFAGGLPAPEIFPVKEVEAACIDVLRTAGQEALQYTITEGFLPLRQEIAKEMHQYGVEAEPPNIFPTNGSQQALDLIGRIFIDPGDVIVTDSPTYLGALQAFASYEPKIECLPLDNDGMQVDHLEEILKRNKVRFLYVLPNFHNPAGVTLSLERRIALVKIAAKYGVPIIEDDPYSQLRFEGEELPAIMTLHKENTIYMSTFSKILAPGLRLGWVVGPQALISKLVQAKQATDLHTSTFVQMVVHNVIQRGFLGGHIKLIRKVYGERRHIMTDAMEQCFPEGVTWTSPQGGLFLWVTAPEGIDTRELLKTAVEHKVAFVPGTYFFPHGGGLNTMRLNFSNAQPDMIREGIKRLGATLKEAIGRLR
ncbi:MAG TPA: PLP-dependent aminotransferase family protein [bacterium]|nr:PLP-dependent aminotransferase family protein [bacterium]